VQVKNIPDTLAVEVSSQSHNTAVAATDTPGRVQIFSFSVMTIINKSLHLHLMASVAVLVQSFAPDIFQQTTVMLWRRDLIRLIHCMKAFTACRHCIWMGSVVEFDILYYHSSDPSACAAVYNRLALGRR